MIFRAKPMAIAAAVGFALVSVQATTASAFTGNLVSKTAVPVADQRIDDARIIPVMGGAVGTRNFLARRLERKLRKRAIRRGIDPSGIYVDRQTGFPVKGYLSKRELDFYGHRFDRRRHR